MLFELISLRKKNCLTVSKCGWIWINPMYAYYHYWNSILCTNLISAAPNPKTLDVHNIKNPDIVWAFEQSVHVYLLEIMNIHTHLQESI